MGIATAHVCSMRQVATMVGSPRIVTGKSVLHPVGDPALDLAGERGLRRRILLAALRALESDGTRDAA